MTKSMAERETSVNYEHLYQEEIMDFFLFDWIVTLYDFKRD